MLNFVVPMFQAVFQQFGKDLPAITQFVVNVSNHFNTILLIVLVLCIFAYVAHKMLSSNDSYQDIKSKIILKIFNISSLLFRKFNSSACYKKNF